MSPRCSSFSTQRCLKSERDQSHNAACITAEVLTYGPLHLLAMRICLRRKFAVHLVETLDRFRYAIGRFEVVAESVINRESRSCKLQTKGVSSQRGTRTKGNAYIESGMQGISPRTACQF
jgi:hypothetical protein